MAITATRGLTIAFSGDGISENHSYSGGQDTSPGVSELKALASGNNTITPPGSTSMFVTIVPPAGNLLALTLKGVAGDTGVGLHLTEPTCVALASPTATFVINAGNTITVRLIWA